ncbi:eCIS core domain-containing protein [Glacieibacterium frigidum]|uniref:DUF4157 domain-containing protein n=1 Tax=Glacieibacterium frigidum TaxID=2593303 RepID=A0A552U6Z4_9SPHN|nr:DUF4157 domain-containing protein [Glacieibacterium frigidum]TRW13988.1 DUF4157 domain-containing protein [Glacieibacterium frigidum]
MDLTSIASRATAAVSDFIDPPAIPDQLGDLAEKGVDHLISNGLAPVAAGVVARGLDNLGSLAADARDTVAGWAGTVRDSLTSLPNSAANALADSMRGPDARTLTPGETTALRSAFGNDIDLSNVRIVDGPGRNPDAWLAFNVGGNPAITEGNTVYVRSDKYVGDFSQSPKGINTLVHEFAHVNQYQDMGFGSFFGKYAHDLTTTGDRNAAYDYASRNTTYATETIEGQAQMLGDYAGHLAGEGKLTPERAQVLETRLRGTGFFGL